MSTILADDPTVIARILDHIDRKTTDLSEGVWLEPVEHYTRRTGSRRRSPTCSGVPPRRFAPPPPCLKLDPMWRGTRR